MTVMMSSDLTSFARERPTIVIIDRQTLSRTALARVLRSELVGYEIIDLACTHAIAELSDRPVALILFNIHGHEMSERCVLEHIGQLRRTLPREALMLLTQQSEATISDATLSEVARAGVRGYVTDRDAIDIAIAAMKLVIAGGVYFPRPVSGGLDEAAAAATAALRDAALAAVPTRLLDAKDVVAVVAEVASQAPRIQVAFTQREQEVIATLQRGLSNKIIANELNLSQNTVKVHISRIMRKLKATNRTEAALAVQRNFLSAEA
ncbi:MAG: response regulator transcription factor [Mesorhizobium sp.]|jgi:DNA-binding NarL/FixJ family response regulator